MKPIALLTMIFIAAAVATAIANDGKYIEAMQRNIKAAYEARDIASLQQSVNAFDRIASAEKSKWEPLYYLAFGNVMMANLEGDGVRKDAYIDAAMAALGKAKVLNENESEIIALEGFALMMRVTVDPATRGMVYAPQAVQAFNRAIALNPENPRALALLAQMQFGTAQFFGSAVKEPCDLNLRAEEKMKTYSSPNPLAPSWGAGMIESLKEKCK